MDVIIAVIVGVIIGVVVTALIVRTQLSGNLRVDHSIPEDNPLMFLELTKSVSTIICKKFVVLKIKKENFIPHK